MIVTDPAKMCDAFAQTLNSRDIDSLALMRQAGRKRDDGTASSRNHSPNNGLIAPNNPVEIDVDNAPPCHRINIGNLHARLDGCRADETVD